MATDVYPGKDLGTLELTITDEMVQHYIKGLDEPNPWYTTASPFGGPVAPVVIYQQADSEFKGWYLDNLFGNLWRRQEWEIHAPTRVGQVLRCSARVCFLAEQTSGEVTLRDPASKEGARQEGEPSRRPGRGSPASGRALPLSAPSFGRSGSTPAADRRSCLAHAQDRPGRRHAPSHLRSRSLCARSSRRSRRGRGSISCSTTACSRRMPAGERAWPAMAPGPSRRRA